MKKMLVLNELTDERYKTYSVLDMESEEIFRTDLKKMRKSAKREAEYVNFDFNHSKIIYADSTSKAYLQDGGDWARSVMQNASRTKIHVYKICGDSYKAVVTGGAEWSGKRMGGYLATFNKDEVSIHDVVNLSAEWAVVHGGIECVEIEPEVDRAKKVMALMGLDFMTVDNFGGIRFKKDAEIDKFIVPEGIKSINFAGLEKANYIKLSDSCKSINGDLKFNEPLFRLGGTYCGHHVPGSNNLVQMGTYMHHIIHGGGAGGRSAMGNGGQGKPSKTGQHSQGGQGVSGAQGKAWYGGGGGHGMANNMHSFYSGEIETLDLGGMESVAKLHDGNFHIKELIGDNIRTLDGNTFYGCTVDKAVFKNLDSINTKNITGSIKRIVCKSGEYELMQADKGYIWKLVG